MKTSERQVGDITIIDVVGRIVFGDGEQDFRDVVTRVTEAGVVKLVINLAEVPYVDSAGISQLVRAHVTTANRGGRMKMLKLTRRVRELLTLTRLLTVMEAFESEEDAIASFKGPL